MGCTHIDLGCVAELYAAHGECAENYAPLRNGDRGDEHLFGR